MSQIKQCLQQRTHMPHGWQDMEGQDVHHYHCNGLLAHIEGTQPAHFMRPDEGGTPAPVVSNAALPDEFLAIIQEAMNVIAEGHAEYGRFAHDRLGLAAQWDNLHRKIEKLFSEFWLGQPKPMREDARTILMELMGHAILCIDLIDRKVPARGTLSA